MKLLPPLGNSRYTSSKTKTFVKQIRKEKIPLGYEMVLFGVTSLFTNVSLYKTAEFILKRVYKKKEITTTIPKSGNKRTSLTYAPKLVITILANIFMVELARTIIIYLSDKIKLWKRL